MSKVTWAYQVRFKDFTYGSGTVIAETKEEAMQKIEAKYHPQQVEIVNLGVRG